MSGTVIGTVNPQSGERRWAWSIDGSARIVKVAADARFI
jgi:hypothetical protein